MISNENFTCLITTLDGKEYKAAKQITRPVKGLDLAMLKFTSNTDYKLTEVGDSTQLKGAEQIYIRGSPGVDATNSKRAIRVSQGNLLSDAVISGSDGQYIIFYNSYTIPGMSGGIVLNSQGKRVGVHVLGSPVGYGCKPSHAAINGGIPIHLIDSDKYTEQSIDEISKLFLDALTLSVKENLSKEDLTTALKKYTTAIQLKPNNALLYFYRSRVYRLLGESSKALADSSQFIKLAPENAFAYNNRAFNYNPEEYDKAIVDYTQATKLDATSVDAYVGRGGIYKQQGEYDKALADYDKSIKLEPNNTSVYFERAAFHDERKDYDRAIANYTRVINLQPSLPVYENRGRIYFKKREYYKALADFNQAIEINPQDASNSHFKTPVL